MDTVLFVLDGSVGVDRGINGGAVIGEHKGPWMLIRSLLGIGEDAIRTDLGLLVRPGFADTIVSSGQFLRVSNHRSFILLLGGIIHHGFGKTRFYICTEGVHGLTVLGKPVHNITMVGGNFLLVALGVADNVLLGQTIQLAQIHAKFNGLPVHLLEIGVVQKTVLADLKADMGVVCRTSGVPSTMVPRKGLVRGDGAVSQLADKGMNADFTATGVVGVPMVVVLVDTKGTVIWAYIAFQPGVVSPCAVNHDALDSNFATCLVAGIFGEDQLTQIHVPSPPLR